MSKMKVQVKCGNNFLCAEGDNTLELMETLSHMFEVFGEKKCQHCGEEDLTYRVRVAGEDKNKFPEIVCSNQQCRAKLSLGSPRDGSGMLYPKRYKMEGKKYVEDDGKKVIAGKWGWVKWERENVS